MTGEAPQFLIAPEGFSSLLAKRYSDIGVEALVPPGVGWANIEPAWTWTVCRWLPRNRLGEHPPDDPGAQPITVLDALRRGQQWCRRSPRQHRVLVWILEQSAYYTQQLLEADPDACADAVDRGLDLLGELRNVATRPQPCPAVLDEALRYVPELASHVSARAPVGTSAASVLPGDRNH